MGYSVFPEPSAGSKTRKVETLTSGTSWTVPAGVTYVNATLIGGGGGGCSNGNINEARPHPSGSGGQIITTTVNTTPGNSIAYAIGAGGAGATNDNGDNGSDGGTTTFTGATSATGGAGGKWNGTGSNGLGGMSANNGAQSASMAGYTYRDGGTGGAGQIIIEYWV